MTYTSPKEYYETTPKAGMRIEGDEWAYPSRLIEGDEWDERYFNTNLRYERNDDIIPSLPVKIEITGRVVYVTSTYDERKIRVLITTWDSNEEPVSFGGWLYLS